MTMHQKYIYSGRKIRRWTPPVALTDLLRWAVIVMVASLLLQPANARQQQDVAQRSGTGQTDKLYAWDTLPPQPFQQGDKWGYKDARDRIVVPAIYDQADAFSDGLAGVASADKWGYINRQGELVIDFQYDYGFPFQESRAVVVVDDESVMIIDRTGRAVTPISYAFAYGYKNGYALVLREGGWTFIDSCGREIVPPRYGKLYYFVDGLAIFRLDGKYGFIDHKGRERVPGIYTMVTPFSEGRAAVLKDGNWGYIDSTGKEVIALKYQDANSFQHGTALVEENDKQFYIDLDGNFVRAAAAEEH